MEGTQEREEYKSKVKKLIEKYNIKKIKKKEIDIKESVGSGGQATVRHGSYNNEEVVIKKLSGRLDWKCLADELEIVQTLEHPCIPKFYGLILDDTILCMVFQYIKGVTLDKLDVMAMEKEVRLDILKKLADTFNYIHTKGYIHRDFKADNVMVDNDLKVWVIDFGIAKKTAGTEKDVVHTKAKGNVFWVAPENFDMDDSNKSEVSYKVDIWGFGLLVSFMFSGVEPWTNYSNNQTKVQNKILEGYAFPIPKSIEDKGILSIIKSCTNYDPKERPTFLELVEIMKKMEQK
jgi:serine/threonine protein kinase